MPKKKKTKVVKPIEKETASYSLRLNYNVEKDIMGKKIVEKEIFETKKGRTQISSSNNIILHPYYFKR